MKAARELRGHFSQRITALEANCQAKRQDLAQAERELEQAEDGVLIGTATEADAKAARDRSTAARQAVTDALDRARRAKPELAARQQAIEDEVRREYQPDYDIAYREPVMRRSRGLKEVAAANADVRRVADLCGGQVNLPVHGWAELDLPDNPEAPGLYSKLSQELRALRRIAYDV